MTFLQTMIEEVISQSGEGDAAIEEEKEQESSSQPKLTQSSEAQEISRIEDISSPVARESIHESDTAVTAPSSEKNTKNKNTVTIRAEPVKKTTSPKKVPPTESKSKPAAPAKPVDPVTAARRQWSSKYYEMTELGGHSDVILAVDSNEKYIVSAR